MKLIIIRHGQSQGNVRGVISTDRVALTQKGVIQARKTAKELASFQISQIFTSDLPRAAQTAQIIGKELEIDAIHPTKKLRECNMGIWKDLPLKEATSKFENLLKKEQKKGVQRSEIRPPQGENSWDHQKRVMSFLNPLLAKNRATDKAILIIGHSGTNRVIIGTLMGRQPPNFYDIPQGNSCINILDIKKDEISFEAINYCDHLK